VSSDEDSLQDSRSGGGAAPRLAGMPGGDRDVRSSRRDGRRWRQWS